MMMWIEVIYIVASFVVRHPNIVLGGRWRAFVYLKVFAQRLTRRIELARYEDVETPGAGSKKAFVESKVDSDNRRF